MSDKDSQDNATPSYALLLKTTGQDHVSPHCGSRHPDNSSAEPAQPQALAWQDSAGANSLLKYEFCYDAAATPDSCALAQSEQYRSSSPLVEAYSGGNSADNTPSPVYALLGQSESQHIPTDACGNDHASQQMETSVSEGGGGILVAAQSPVALEDDDSPFRRFSARRLSAGTERRVHVSEQMREMFLALPDVMGRRTSGVSSQSSARGRNACLISNDVWL